ncbi:MAG: hypothetical protein AAGA27_02005 [Pseudomonadota bacterium]
MDRLLNWFTISGYKNLIGIYLQYSNLPKSLLALVRSIQHYAHLAMPLQASLEAFLGICLVVLLF